MTRGLIIALMMAATPVMGQDVALLIGNRDYPNARDIAAADDLPDASEALSDAGFRVFRGDDLTAAEQRDLVQEFANATRGADRIVIGLSGHFARASFGGWFLGTDADEPDLVSAGVQGMPLDVILAIAARAPGRSVVLLGTEDRNIELGWGIRSGFPGIQAPQGVMVIRGDADDIADFVEGPMLERGQSLMRGLRDYPSFSVIGFRSNGIAFLPSERPRLEEPAPQPQPEPGFGNRGSLGAERAAWAAALADDTIDAYQDFLRSFPNGVNAESARAAIDRLRDEPEADAQGREEALRLTRDQRRSIQRQLTLLDYNTRGIDGIFGPATRRAIGAWQRANQFQPTTYLDREQIVRIGAQAERRSAELEAEAERRRAEQERLDRAYWSETGARGDEAGLRAYLERYPDGLYSDVAAERLRPFDDRRRREAEAADRDAWERATERDTVESYRRYLEDRPRGAFRERAEERIAALRRDDENEGAARAEQALGLNRATRNLVEAKLRDLGLNPGRVDGNFDRDTRRAIRRYQQARNIPATGYLSQDTVVRLLADSIFR